MPEYLSPGVYIEETTYRAKAIEGVATSTAGFVGQCRFGPYSGTPTLVTSFEEFQRYFGDFSDLLLDNVQQTNHLAHAVRLFFENGGARVYIARIFRPTAGRSIDELTASSIPLATSAGPGSIRARFPGRAGNVVVTIQGARSGNLRTGQGDAASLSGVRPGDIIELSTGTPLSRVVRPSSGTGTYDPLTTDVGRIGTVSFDATGQPVVTTATGTINLANFSCAQRILLTIVTGPNQDGSTGPRSDSVQGLSASPDSTQYVGKVLRTEDPAEGIGPPPDESNRIWVQLPDAPAGAQDMAAFGASIVRSLIDMDQGRPFRLTQGQDGSTALSDDFVGKGGDGEGSDRDVTGLVALGAVEDIAIVAAPGSGALDDDTSQAVRDALIIHCQNLKYRFAVLAADQNADLPKIREVRGKMDSTYAALYYPWLIMQSPFAPRETLALSPEGAAIGIYARTDIARGVWKAPANEVVNGILRFSREINKGQQDVLNPDGINCLRFFVGRGYRVWGARTISSDIEWLYVNVRRLFIYLEHSIDRGTQWAVFEPNNEQLWLKIRLTIESFLYDTWRTGALMGSRPEQAYFVRCDRTTMTQSDLDNGRLICLIGVAPTKPAEFVIFRIGQWTAEASII